VILQTKGAPSAPFNTVRLRWDTLIGQLLQTSTISSTFVLPNIVRSPTWPILLRFIRFSNKATPGPKLSINTIDKNLLPGSLYGLEAMDRLPLEDSVYLCAAFSSLRRLGRGRKPKTAANDVLAVQ
jgi:hypothetical protein